MEIKKFREMIKELHPDGAYEPVLRKGIDYPTQIRGILIKVPERIRASELAKFFSERDMLIYQEKRIKKLFRIWRTSRKKSEDIKSLDSEDI